MGFVESITAEASLATVVLYASLTSLAAYIIYRTYLDPLSHVPGPLICRLTSFWCWGHSFVGDESRQIQALHERYGPVVRIAPNEVIFSEGEALAPIYSEKGGFLKAPAYANFDSEGHQTIFSALDPAHRAKRSKAVMPLFSTGALRTRSDAIESCIDRFIQRLRRDIDKARETAKQTGKASPVDVLNLSRGLAIDSVCSYLFGKSYGGCSETSTQLSASRYVDSVVSIGRFFFLPPYLFIPVFMLYQKLYPATKEELLSQDKVENFTFPLVSNPPADQDLYQTRLTAAGISPEETDVQMKDVIFAGTDTTGTNFSMLLWNLAKHPQIYEKLQQEVLAADHLKASSAENDNLPYLEAIVKESLRTSMANPTRFPRIVPPQGWTYTSPSSNKTYHFPGGTQVGLQPWTLHFNPAVFPEPQAFNPARWLMNPSKEMIRDWIPFGLGPRQCIARNLAMHEMRLATAAVARAGILEGARVVKERIEVVEWFNAKVVGEKIEIVWE